MIQVDDATLAAAAEAAQHVPTDGELLTAKTLAQSLVVQQLAVLELENKLKTAKEDLKDLSERELPQVLNSLGLTALTLADGWSLELKPFTAVGVVKDHTTEAYDELVALGAADLIKNTVAVTFGRGEDELAGHVRWLLTLFGFQPTQEKNVHHQTLNAWFREQVRQDPLFRLDAELFTCFVGQVAKLKEPKPS